MKLTSAEVRAVVALAIGMFCVQVDFFALSLALPSMAVDLHQTTTNLQWVLSAYMIAVGAAMIPADGSVICAVTDAWCWPVW